MDNFTKMELLGRDKFESLLIQMGITNYYFTPEKYNPVDCYFNNSSQWMAEIKVRDKFWNPLFMEVQKYKAMKQIVKDGGAENGLYVNFIDNRCYIFILSQICQANGCYTKYIYANRHTAISTEDKVDKLIICLPTKLATIYEWDGTRWNDVK